MEREDKPPLSNCCPKTEMFYKWMTHEDRPYELHDDFLATLTRDSYLKFRHMDTQSFSASSPSHHEPSKLKTSFPVEFKHQTTSESQTALNNFKKGTKSIPPNHTHTQQSLQPLHAGASLHNNRHHDIPTNPCTQHHLHSSQPHINQPNTQQIDFVPQGATPQT